MAAAALGRFHVLMLLGKARLRNCPEALNFLRLNQGAMYGIVVSFCEQDEFLCRSGEH